MWKGTTASLNPKPTVNKIVAISNMGSSNPFELKAAAMAFNLVLPVSP
jgi:hypothetical protein